MTRTARDKARERKPEMEQIGWAATIVVAALAVAAVVVGVRSVPDIKRYLRMRRM